MPQNQRARLNWLDRVVLVAAAAVLAASLLVCILAVSFDARIARAINEVRLNRQVGCSGQQHSTGSTVPACRTLGP